MASSVYEDNSSDSNSSQDFVSYFKVAESTDTIVKDNHLQKQEKNFNFAQKLANRQVGGNITSLWLSYSTIFL